MAQTTLKACIPAHPARGLSTTFYRPPPLRTIGTYDDDEFFNNVALNMISRYEALNLTVQEAIYSTLICPRSRASFYEGLCSRISRTSSMSPSVRSLVQSMKSIFDKELKKIVDSESPGGFYSKQQAFPDFDCPPITPRSILRVSSSGSAASVGNNTAKAAQVATKKKKQSSKRMFFPDSSGDSKGRGFFRTRKVQNIDWKMAEAITQVQSLRLDGDERTPTNRPVSGLGYQPPRLC